MTPDTLEATLRKSPLTNAQRADLWDAFEGSKDEDELATRLQGFNIPRQVKAQLWDMKAGAAPSSGVGGDDEADFRSWYARHAQAQGLNPDPDDPEHFYDYRAAFRAGAAPDASGHWPSQFKREGHPNLVINGVDTRTGQPANERRTVLSDGGQTLMAEDEIASGRIVPYPRMEVVRPEHFDPSTTTGKANLGVGIGAAALASAPAIGAMSGASLTNWAVNQVWPYVKEYGGYALAETALERMGVPPQIRGIALGIAFGRRHAPGAPGAGKTGAGKPTSGAAPPPPPNRPVGASSSGMAPTHVAAPNVNVSTVRPIPPSAAPPPRGVSSGATAPVASAPAASALPVPPAWSARGPAAPPPPKPPTAPPMAPAPTPKAPPKSKPAAKPKVSSEDEPVRVLSGAELASAQHKARVSFAREIAKSNPKVGEKIWMQLDESGVPIRPLTPAQAGAAARAGKPTTWIKNLWQ